MKKTISLFLALVMVLATFTFLPVSATSGTMSGTGTSTDPYLVADKADFQAIGTGTYAADAYYKLTDNIDFGGMTTNWDGIANKDLKFAGTLDGAGFALTNFTVGTTPIFKQKLENGATFKNLKVGTSEAAIVVGGAEKPYQFGIFGVQPNAGATVSFENVHIYINANMPYAESNVSAARNFGGFFSNLPSGVTANVKNCSVNGTVTHSYPDLKQMNDGQYDFGGFAGIVNAGATLIVDGFTFDVDVTSTLVSKTGLSATYIGNAGVVAYGGLIGSVACSDSAKPIVTVSNFSNTGTIEVTLENTAAPTEQTFKNSPIAKLGGCIGFVYEKASRYVEPSVSITSSTFGTDALLTYSGGFYSVVAAGNTSFDAQYVSSKGYMIGGTAYVDAASVTLTNNTNASADQTLKEAAHLEYQHNIKFIGVQKNSTANSIRFLAVVDSLNYDKVTFEVKTTYGTEDYTWTQDVTSAYTSIQLCVVSVFHIK